MKAALRELGYLTLAIMLGVSVGNLVVTIAHFCLTPDTDISVGRQR